MGEEVKNLWRKCLKKWGKLRHEVRTLWDGRMSMQGVT